MKLFATVLITALLSVAGAYLLFVRAEQQKMRTASTLHNRYQIVSSGSHSDFILLDSHTGHSWERASTPYHEWRDLGAPPFADAVKPVKKPAGSEAAERLEATPK